MSTPWQIPDPNNPDKEEPDNEGGSEDDNNSGLGGLFGKPTEPEFPAFRKMPAQNGPVRGGPSGPGPDGPAPWNGPGGPGPGPTPGGPGPGPTPGGPRPGPMPGGPGPGPMPGGPGPRPGPGGLSEEDYALIQKKDKKNDEKPKSKMPVAILGVTGLLVALIVLNIFTRGNQEDTPNPGASEETSTTEEIPAEDIIELPEDVTGPYNFETHRLETQTVPAGDMRICQTGIELGVGRESHTHTHTTRGYHTVKIQTRAYTNPQSTTGRFQLENAAETAVENCNEVNIESGGDNATLGLALTIPTDEENELFILIVNHEQYTVTLELEGETRTVERMKLELAEILYTYLEHIQEQY